MPNRLDPRKSLLTLAVAIALSPAAATAEMDSALILQEIQAMKIRIQDLEAQLSEAQSAKQEAQQAKQQAQAAQQEATQARQDLQQAKLAANDEAGIKVGGAVRFQYSNEQYNRGNRSRGGDLDFDLFRLNLDGAVGDMILSAEWRWYQYMNVVHHAWIGYDFSEGQQGQLGIHRVPFGILPYNSHNFFFSSNFYVGLEDDYDAGVKYLHQYGPWDLRLGFYLNDEQGGIDGYVDDRNKRYSYDIVGYRDASEGIYDQPANPLAENNTWNARLAYTLDIDESFNIEFGLSGQYGLLNDGSSNKGDHQAYALHLLGNYGRWNLQLQAATYQYDVDGGADLMAVGAFAFYDSIPAKADTYTANLAYSLPVAWGPVTNLTFYNDYSLLTNKPANLDDTWMNVTGVMMMLNHAQS